MFESKTNSSVQECGIFLHESGLLGASPDGKIDDQKILEIKCPYKYRELPSLKEAALDKHFFLFHDGVSFHLKEDSDYFHQIQGQIHITGASMCYLVVYIPNDCIILPIPKDVKWSHNIDKLLNFYGVSFLPYILSSVNCDIDLQ